ncbi:MAG: Holliday junction branch migration protein RuvA [bacterium]|nr:Holliday junction branch migration protein RuvA [bacterium]
MLASLSGKILKKIDHAIVLGVGGVGFKVLMSERSLKALPVVGGVVDLSTHLYVRENGLELYGFLSSEELRFFELLISVSGVGPKSALSILSVADIMKLSAAITEGRSDLLSKASGIGTKTAARIIVELKSKVSSPHAESMVATMDADSDILDMLANLGYKREAARAALGKVPADAASLEERMKAVLKILSGK